MPAERTSSISIITRRRRRKRPNQQGKTLPRKMIIRTENGKVMLRVPFAPREVQYSNLARTYTEINRPGRRPLLSAATQPLPKISFDLFLGRTDPDRDVERQISILRQLARRRARLVVSFGPSESGLWHLSALSVSSVHRHHINQSITRATATVEFTRVSEGNAKVGPTKGGHKGNSGSKVKVYRVKKGDTLHRIAVYVFDNPRMWRAIADRNRIRNPKRHRALKVGRKLRMPRTRR